MATKKRVIKKRVGVLETMGPQTESVEVETEESKSPDSKRKEKLLERAKERYKVISEYWADNRKLALEAIKFRSGDHWPEKIKKEREEDGRPCLTLDKINQYIRQVVNDGRQNRPSIKFRPVDDKGDVKVAGAFQGLARSILAKSRADQAFDTSLDHAAGHGFGYFRLLTDYCHKGSFEQDIKVLRVRNSLSVLLAPHQNADGSDAEDGFILDTVTKGVFTSKWPKAEKVNWSEDSKDYASGWLTDEFVTVAEYFYKEPTETTLYLLEDGTTVEKDEYDATAKAFTEVGLPAPAYVNERIVRGEKVKWCRMTGAEILEERDWLGEYIPIIPVYGTETDIEGKVTYTGMVREAMDGQMLYDFARTAFAERVALTPKAPWVAAEGQTEHNPNWQTANTKNHSILTYNPVEIMGNVLPAPQRQQASDVPSGYGEEMRLAEHDIQAALGMYNASLGAQSNEKSGRAIMARQREGDVATFHYHDNLNRAIQYLGKQLVDLIPKVYDTKRIVRLLEEDGTTKDAMVAPELPGGVATAKDERGLEVFNLGAGRYDVETTTGPSYTTKRMESAESMLEMAKMNPALMQTHMDLIVKSQDWPDAEAFAKRAKAIMPPDLRAAIEKEEAKDEPDDKVKQVIEAAKGEIQARDQALEQAKGMLGQAAQAAQDLQRQIDNLKERGNVEVTKAALTAREQVLAEQDRADKAEEELRLTKALEQMEDLQEATLKAVQELVAPPPAIEQPEAVEPVGPSPDVMAILGQFQAQSEAIMRALTAPRRRQLIRGADGRPESMIEMPMGDE